MQKITTLSPLSSHKLLKNKIEYKEKNNHLHYKTQISAKKKPTILEHPYLQKKAKKLFKK